MYHFWAQNAPFAQTNVLIQKIIKIILIYLLATFIVQNCNIILKADAELLGWVIFGPKMANLPKLKFILENLLISLVSFIHVYLHAKNRSQILIY